MKYLLLLVLFGLPYMLVSQTGQTGELETYTYCLVDSVSPSNQKQIFAVMDVARKEKRYYNDHNLATPYTPTGTLIPCFDLVGNSECRLRSVSNSSNKRKFSLTISDVSAYHTDISLAGIEYEEFLGMGNGPGKNMARIPLNYPYRNTVAEANRFTADIKAWLECKGVHYIDSSTYALVGVYAMDFQIHTVRNNFDINLDNAIYQRSFRDPDPTWISKSGQNTVVNSVSTFEVCEVFRKEKNGAIYYIIPYYNSTPLYPNDATFGLLDRRIDCNYQSLRIDHCDRPAMEGCYKAPLDSMVCTYDVYIPYNYNITSIYINGGVTLPIGTYSPGVQPDHKQLQDTIQKWLYWKNYFGIVSVENTKSTTYDAWHITISNTDMPFDSIQTSSGRYYFKRTNCNQYLYYQVSRNELGGITSCIDQYGRNLYCPPDLAEVIPCSQQVQRGCQNLNMFGGEILNSGSKIFDMTQFSSISFYQSTGNGALVMKTRTGATHSLTLAANREYSFQTKDLCNYFDSGTIQYNWTSGFCNVTYTW